jgi:type IX secretion system PorP/SprF family membrane protein
MNKLLRAFKVFIFLIGLAGTASAQDAVFSQYFASSLYLSPCFAGIDPHFTVGVNTRTQWKSIGTPYVTNQISMIKPFYRYGLTDHNVGGVGISVFQDKAGDTGFQTLGANVSGAYNIYAGEHHTITLGLQVGVMQKQLSLDKLRWGSQYNPGLGEYDGELLPDQIIQQGLLQERKMLIDVGAGIMYYFKAGRDRREKGMSFWLGYSAYHLNRPNESLIQGVKSNLPMMSKMLGGFEFTLGTRFNLSPNVLVAMQGRDVEATKGMTNMQINGGMYITYLLLDPTSDMKPKDLILGGWYRVNDSFIASVGIASNLYTIGFSYDLNQSSLKTATAGKGAWEVSLKIHIPKKEKVKRYYTPRI